MEPINLYALIKDMVHQKADPDMSGRLQMSYQQADRLMFDIKNKIAEVRKTQKVDASDLLGWARFKLEGAVCLMPHHSPAHVLRRTPFMVESWAKVPEGGGMVIGAATWSGLTMTTRQICRKALETDILSRDFVFRVIRHADKVSVEIMNSITGRKRRIAVFTALAFNQFIAGADHE